MFLTWARRGAATRQNKDSDMFGFFIGTMCLFGLIATFKRRRYWAHYAYGMGHHDGFGPRAHDGHPAWAGAADAAGWRAPWSSRHGGWGVGRRGSRRDRLRGVFEQMDTTPGQEKAIVKIVDSFMEQFSAGREELIAVRKQVAQALGGDELDESILSAAMERVEDLIARSKLELTQALTEIHATLDGPQRKMLAELIADGLPRPGYGYRHERF